MTDIAIKPSSTITLGPVADLEKHRQEIYSISSYHWALSIIPIGLLIAAAIAWLLPKPISIISPIEEINK